LRSLTKSSLPLKGGGKELSKTKKVKNMKYKTSFNRKLTFSAFIMFVIIGSISLGIWQMQRLKFKDNLVAQYEKYKAAEPALLNLKDFDQKRDLFKKVKIQGVFLNESEIYLGAKYLSSNRDKSELGYHIITPFKTKRGDVLFVNRGWVPQDKKDPATRPESITKKRTEITAMIRESQGKAPWFMPQNQPEKNIWFWIDIPAMTKFLNDAHIKKVQPVLLQEIRSQRALPVNVSEEIEFYNQHLTYIWMWFGISLAIFICWIFYIKKHG
jgi:surfeit locus 1 family protein